jgi:hypothetical protein
MELFKDTAEDEIRRLRAIIAKLEESKGERVVRVEWERKVGYGYVFYITAPTTSSEETFGMALAKTIRTAFHAVGLEMGPARAGGDHVAPPMEEPGIPENMCYVAKGAFGRFVIVNALDRRLAWSGSRWVVHDKGIPRGAAQVSNFESREAALEGALKAKLDVALTGCVIDSESITCFRCGMTSYNRHDMENSYCGNCCIFHEAGLLPGETAVIQ